MANNIKNINDYIAAIQKANDADNSKKHLFYRGVSSREYALIPKVYRENKYKERDIVLDYKHYLPTTGVNYDYPKDILKMLADMQHYGIPTRLLDWTTSPLVALYFACIGNETKDGKIYIFNAWKYWDNIVEKQRVSDIHEIHIKARALFSIYKDFAEVSRLILREFDYQINEELLQKPFPFVSSFCNDRIINQKGCFTIHGQNKDSLNSQHNGEITELIISSTVKNKILDELAMFGIDDYLIYPDFEGMRNLFNRKGSLFNK